MVRQRARQRPRVACTCVTEFEDLEIPLFLFSAWKFGVVDLSVCVCRSVRVRSPLFSSMFTFRFSGSRMFHSVLCSAPVCMSTVRPASIYRVYI